MKLRIVSEGSGRTTRVENADTGEIIDGVVKVEWEVDVESLALARITLHGTLIDAVVPADDTRERG